MSQIEAMNQRQETEIGALRAQLNEEINPWVINQDQMPVIACNCSFAMGMIVSAIAMLLIWCFCRKKWCKRKDEKFKESDSDRLNKHESDDEVVLDGIMMMNDGQHVTAGWTKEETTQRTTPMDWSEEHDGDEKRGFE